MLHILQTRTDPDDHGRDHASGGVHRRQIQLALIAMPNRPADRRQHAGVLEKLGEERQLSDGCGAGKKEMLKLTCDWLTGNYP